MAEVSEIHDYSDLKEKSKKKEKDPNKSSKKKFSKKYAFSVVMSSQEWFIYASHEEEKRSWMTDLNLLVFNFVIGHKKEQLQH